MPMGLPERGLSTAVLMPGKSKGVHLGGSSGRVPMETMFLGSHSFPQAIAKATSC